MRIRRAVSLVVLAMLIWAAAGASAALVSAPGHRREPACFGAAARVPGHRCNNPILRFTVVPTPSEAQIMPSSPCAPIEAPITVCTFGLPPAKARGTIALIGDSHAWHWRPAVEVAADALGWHALNSTRSSCPFTAGITLLPEPEREECTRWDHAVPRWLEQHPEVSTVFVSTHPGAVVRHRRQDTPMAQVAGYIGAWRALPASVKHIVVIRDVPYVHEDTLPCVEAAVSKHESPGLACAVPRDGALRFDPEVAAAKQLHSARVQVIDLTQFFCDRRLCYPVVGGALVYRNADHLTRVFAATLGPFLLHQLGWLMKSWY